MASDQYDRTVSPVDDEGRSARGLRLLRFWLKKHLQQRGLDPAARHRVIEAVGLRSTEGWSVRFTLMMAFSMVVAVMGMSAGSAAVVIGAMLLAPLMTPVMGVAAALSMGLPGPMMRPLAQVAFASVGSVAGAYVLAMSLADGALSTEILSRTSPDVRDLLVALAAGAAGAYATVRPDVSSALPGVAVAVALVPPLAAAGLTLEAGRGDLASGALLLYGANLAAIVLVAVTVFVLTGFVPVRRLRAISKRVFLGAAVAGIATLAAAVPLALATVSAAETGRDRAHLEEVAAGWLQGTGDDLDELRVDGKVVQIRVSGPNPPPDTAALLRSARQVLGSGASIQVRWTQVHEADVREGDDRSDARDRLEQVEAAVDEWLAGRGDTFEVTDISVTQERVDVDVTSADPPPGVDRLSERLNDELELGVEVVVNWTRRTTFVPTDKTDVTPTVEDVKEMLEATVHRWARGHDGVELQALDYDGVKLSVDLVGPAPVDVAVLAAQLREIVGQRSPVDIWFTQRQRVGA